MGRGVRRGANNRPANRSDCRVHDTNRARLAGAQHRARPGTGTARGARRSRQIATAGRSSDMSHSPRSRSTVSRRDVAKLAIGLSSAALLPSLATAQSIAGAIIAKPIPSSGETIPAVGLGTAYVFDRTDDPTQRAAQQVVEALVSEGGRLVDTASTYGDAEIVLGNAMATAGL